MLQARYAEALEDFVTYRDQNGSGEHAAAALFRSGVCRFGLEEIDKAEALFSEFISTYKEDVLIFRSTACGVILKVRRRVR